MKALTVTTGYHTNNNRFGLCYTLANGKKGSTFIPTALAMRGDVEEMERYLMERMGLELPAKSLDDALKGLSEELALEGDFEINRWSKGGHDRLYINLMRKNNGGKNWNGGLGGAWYVCLVTGKSVQSRDWAGAATRNSWESDVDALIARIQALVA